MPPSNQDPIILCPTKVLRLLLPRCVGPPRLYHGKSAASQVPYFEIFKSYVEWMKGKVMMTTLNTMDEV